MAKEYWVGFTHESQKEAFVMMLISEDIVTEVILGLIIRITVE